MTPRRLPLRPETIEFLQRARREAAAPIAPVGWTHRTMALALHAAGVALFGLLVVWPVVSPLAGNLPGKLPAAMQPALQAWSTWSSELAREVTELSEFAPEAAAAPPVGECRPVCPIYVR